MVITSLGRSSESWAFKFVLRATDPVREKEGRKLNREPSQAKQVNPLPSHSKPSRFALIWGRSITFSIKANLRNKVLELDTSKKQFLLGLDKPRAKVLYEACVSRRQHLNKAHREADYI